MVPFVIVAVVLALASWRALDTLALGDDVARSLGASLARSRGLCALAVVATAGIATAACGPISFVGLVVPHMVRRFTGPEHRWLLPYSAIVGAILLLGSDIIGRVIARPAEVQVGIVTALVGAPFFVYLAPAHAPGVSCDAHVDAPTLRRSAVRCGAGRISARLDARAIAVSWVMLVAIFVLFCWTVSVGDFPIPIVDVIRTMLRRRQRPSRSSSSATCACRARWSA